MLVRVPKKIKEGEKRATLTVESVKDIVKSGFVAVETCQVRGLTGDSEHF